MKDNLKILENVLGSERVKLDEPLKYHLISAPLGAAELFYIATTIKELEQALNTANELKIPVWLFGGGTKAQVGSQKLEGLVIKNRTSGIKISGVKGKVSPKGIGIEEALVEAESGVSLPKLNEFVSAQGLKLLSFPMVENETIGGSIYNNSHLQNLVQKVKVWSEGEIFDIDIVDLKREDYIMSVIIKLKSAS